MTPKEKAKELVDKFMNSDNMIFLIKGAKECALIAVDEIISELEDVMNFTGNQFSLKLIKYWQEVKQEIENL